MTTLFRRCLGSGFDFSLFISCVFDLFTGCFGWLGLAVGAAPSVGDVGEGSHNHDHGAAEEGNVRMTVHERWAQESADPIDSIQTLETIGIR